MSTSQFQKLVKGGRQVGEVIAVDKFMIKIRGMQNVNVHALILFEDNSKGYVHDVYEDYVVVLHLGSEPLGLGMLAVVQNEQLVSRVGKNYLGRVISVLGEPLDGKGPIQPDGTWPVFHDAPPLYERELLDTPFETGITVIDILFSLVRGQRMALVGNSKTGKSSLATQIAINQRTTDVITIYVLIGTRRADLVQLVERLESNGALANTIVIASTMFESLVLNYMAPYVAAAMGEYFWQHCDMDTFIVYDDLTSHAMAYREISLLSGVSPGRDSYPGDMFYVHSSLVERAGKLNRNHKSQTILPLVYAPDGDITAYLPTNVMSMSDGQWILDMRVFKEVMRPAVSSGLSVSRVGGVAHNKRQKALAVKTSKALAAYAIAEEYAHFGSELSADSEADLIRGKNLYNLFNQKIGETYTELEQQLLLEIIIDLSTGESIDIMKLKELVHDYVKQIKDDDGAGGGNFGSIRDDLKKACLVQQNEHAGEERDDPNETSGDQGSNVRTDANNGGEDVETKLKSKHQRGHGKKLKVFGL